MAILWMIAGLIVGTALGFGLFAALQGVPVMAVFLILLGGAMIGFVGGMLFMRDGYLAVLVEERMDKLRMQAQAERRADEQRRIGYAVGLMRRELEGRK